MSNGINDDEYYSDSDDENDEWFGIGESELVQSSIACGLSSMTLDDLDELGKANVSDPNAYHLSEFKDGMCYYFKFDDSCPFVICRLLP